MRHKQPSSYRLSPEALRLLELLAAKLGLSRAGCLEMAIRELAESKRIG